MALAGRSARRGSAGVRWLAAAVVITLFILLIDASLNSRSVGPGQQLAAGAWYDQVLPLVTDSTEEGQVVQGIWTAAAGSNAAADAIKIDGVVTGAARTYQQLVKLRPPVDLTGQAGLLEACLLARSEAAQSLEQAFTETLGVAYPGVKTPATPVATAAGQSGLSPPVQALQTAQARMQVGDQAYQLFLSSLPASLGLKFMPSVWLAETAPYQSQAATVFLSTLQNSVVTTPVHQVKVYSLSTTPAPVSTQGGVQILPDAGSLFLTFVVADVGNQPEANLTVRATISPAGGGASSVVDFLSLVPGQYHSVVGLGPLNPPQGVPVTLTVTVTPPAGSTTPVVTEPLVFQMPGQIPTTTTTQPSSSSTTTSSLSTTSSSPPTT